MIINSNVKHVLLVTIPKCKHLMHKNISVVKKSVVMELNLNKLVMMVILRMGMDAAALVKNKVDGFVVVDLLIKQAAVRNIFQNKFSSQQEVL